MSQQAPNIQVRSFTVPAVAAGADAHAPAGAAPFDGAVTAVTYTPEAAVTGANVETRTLTLVNKGQAGLGATVVATLAFVSGVNGVAYDEKPFTLSAVAGATTVAADDVLELVTTHSGATGLADPGGRVEIEYTRA